MEHLQRLFRIFDKEYDSERGTRRRMPFTPERFIHNQDYVEIDSSTMSGGQSFAQFGTLRPWRIRVKNRNKWDASKRIVPTNEQVIDEVELLNQETSVSPAVSVEAQSSSISIPESVSSDSSISTTPSNSVLNAIMPGEYPYNWDIRTGANTLSRIALYNRTYGKIDFAERINLEKVIRSSKETRVKTKMIRSVIPHRPETRRSYKPESPASYYCFSPIGRRNERYGGEWIHLAIAGLIYSL